MRTWARLICLLVAALFLQRDRLVFAAESGDAQAFLVAAQQYADLLSGSGAADAWQRYTNELRGTRAVRWEGTVAKIDAGASPAIWLHPGSKGAAGAPRLVVRTRDPRLLRELRVGQRVRVSGTVVEVYKDGEVKVALDNAALTTSDGTPLGAPSPLPPPSSTPQDPAGLRITLTRTACYGSCPVYLVSVDQDGVVTWEGQAHVGARGPRHARVPRATVQKLLQRLEQAGFFAMPDYNTRMATDHASVTITVERGGQRKRVEHYLGDSTAPPQLTQLEADIDSTLHTRAWIGEPARPASRRSRLVPLG